jgi:glycosyltransferase involved in cell wall biosynthesis
MTGPRRSAGKVGKRALFTESSPNMGGQEWQLLQQMGALRAHGVESSLACRPDSRIAEEAVRLGIEPVLLPFRNSFDPVTIAGLRSVLARQDISACVCHSGHDTNNVALAARLVATRPRLVRSRTYHAGRASSWTYNLLTDVTMVPSEFLRRRILENPRITPDRLLTVYPGIDFDRLDADSRLPLPSELGRWLDAERGPLIVQVAMLRAEKGHRTIIEALPKLLSRWPHLRYVAAGVGPMKAELCARIEQLGCSKHVWIGEVRPVAALLSRADVLVMPSLTEPLGMAQIEALGLGVPVVASEVDGIPETVRHSETGLLAPPDDDDAWARLIDYAIGHPDEMKRLAARGRHDVRTRFSVRANTDALLKLLRIR